ncbi:hypothetical protein HYC85_014067 [Camellia sinensis]|uniref:Multiple myeloma tumor-associated protein 2-like N-terminal domain-containing protein n=1 Tax=Camellia sinensis TaxID=4442 RepID=A0A7J7H571_CAMSI|nr:hypothetical protein HYC85_014067 [Camellia sinensis]
MYHPTRGGVRGGRDQFTWDDVKVDKHRENYLGHSIKAPVGRWQKGKDLNWYARDKKSQGLDMEAAKEEIRRIKEEEEQAMREALGLAPKRASRSQGTRLDKHEFSELVKRGSTAEDLGAGHAEAAQVQGLGFSRAPRAWEESSSLQPNLKDELPEKMEPSISSPTVRKSEESDDERSRKKRRREEKKHEKHEKRSEKRHSRDSDDKRRSKKGKERRRHDSD